VITHLKREEMPGKPSRVVACVKCGEKVFDGKDTIVNDEPVCMACLGGTYYSLV
jgi:formylmethanofuran dehydrogenase subunit E